MSNYYLPFDKVVIRTPLFSFQDYVTLKNRESDIFKKALYFASPEFYQAYIKDEKDIKKKQKISLTINNYYSRACTRCTPFGLFAGCSIGTRGKKNKICLSPMKDIACSIRGDMQLLVSLVNSLERNPRINKYIKYYPNNTIYKVYNNIRYIEYQILGYKRIHNIIEIPINLYLEKILMVVKSGETIENMIDVLVKEGVKFREAQNFIKDLLDLQILKSELEIVLTGNDFLERLIEKVRNIPDTTDICVGLNSLKNLLNNIVKDSSKFLESHVNNIVKILEVLNVNYDIKYLFQLDTFRPTLKSTLSNDIFERIIKVVTFLNKVTVPSLDYKLEKFKELFLQRYGLQEVALQTIFDPDYGIGYIQNNTTSKLLEGLFNPDKQNSQVFQLNENNQILLKKYITAIKNGECCICLEDQDFMANNEKWDDLSPTIQVLCSIIKDFSGKDVIYIKDVGNTSAANLLGRFSHIDSSVCDFVKEIMSKEEEILNEYVVAEVIHLPNNRYGNILFRSQSRKYEIPCLTVSSKDDRFKIPLSDIVVSVVQDRIILRSISLGCEIIPRLTTAHDYTFDTIPIYDFLCRLQAQNMRVDLRLDYSDFFRIFDYLPEIRYQNCILSRQKWKILKKYLNEWNSLSDYCLLKNINLWRLELKIPQYVVYLQDNKEELLINFDNIISIKAFLVLVKSKKDIWIEEFLFSRGSCVHNEAGEEYCNEILFALYKNI